MISNHRLIIIRASNNQVILNMSLMKLSYTRDITNPKRNSLKVKENEVKAVVLSLIYDTEKTAEVEFELFQDWRNSKAETLLNEVVNGIIEYEVELSTK